MGLFKLLGGAWFLRRYPQIALATMAYGLFKRRKAEKRQREAASREHRKSR